METEKFTDTERHVFVMVNAYDAVEIDRQTFKDEEVLKTCRDLVLRGYCSEIPAGKNKSLLRLTEKGRKAASTQAYSKKEIIRRKEADTQKGWLQWTETEAKALEGSKIKDIETGEIYEIEYVRPFIEPIYFQSYWVGIADADGEGGDWWIYKSRKGKTWDFA